MYFPSLGQMVIAAPLWLAGNLHGGADTQSARQFSSQLSPWQPPFNPFHLKLVDAVISAQSRTHFSNGEQIVDYCGCQKSLELATH